MVELRRATFDNPHPLALLVDPDADTRRMYAEFLKATSAVEEAEDGREALAKAISRRPHIVFTETRLPGMSGFELCALLRTDISTKDTPVVFVTGDAFERDIDQAKRSGADDVLIKPCLPETLQITMQRLLAQSAELRARTRATLVRVEGQLARSRELRATSQQLRRERRLTLSRAHVRRSTSTPDLAPPSLVCPACDAVLVYTRSHTGGVNAHMAEQWDYFECPAGCGTFQYRQRTRKLRSC